MQHVESYFPDEGSNLSLLEAQSPNHWPAREVPGTNVTEKQVFPQMVDNYPQMAEALFFQNKCRFYFFILLC